MDVRKDGSAVRGGRFLWMDEKAKKRYLAAINKKIAEGFFSSEQIILRIVDEMAPVFNDFLDTKIPEKNDRAGVSHAPISSL
jgi:hypothetical protein